MNKKFLINLHKKLSQEEWVEYWGNRPPQERLEALEFIRQITYGYDETLRMDKTVIEFGTLDDLKNKS